MEAAAKYDFEATADDELTFRKGEKLKAHSHTKYTFSSRIDSTLFFSVTSSPQILQTTGDWYKAERNGVQGFVPKNFISIHLPSWYQEDTSRRDAETKLMPESVGAFIIRACQSGALGDFSISVRKARDVEHFKVLQDSGHYVLWAEKFSSLNQLVEYYQKHSISKETPIFLRDTREEQQRGTSDRLPRLPAALPKLPPLDRPDLPARHQVRAVYSFQAEEKDELEFNAGDIIEVLECPDRSWWRGQLRGKTGLFPSNYTEAI
ncbi:GRB2-related adapter protein 2b isoform X2 [Echeneis naucrates]|uniref:GRB2-related adapter protein 2b isoform X2 n=1 Tax=Echeneis naucrates TaxID=173247 RepID=UPI0011145524|nr:GRB2-related adapter protein 2-like isoform X2 [Echeneis naucrates]